jgi:paraquat-inducible protein B
MSHAQKNAGAGEDLPKAKVRRRQWRFPVVWMVPVVAALVAGYLVYHRVHEFGAKITIEFRDGSGLKIGQTPIKYRGVTVGEVTAVELSTDQQSVFVEARLRRSAAAIARGGSLFWIVRPQVGLGNITGLGTIITGPHIEVLPGTGGLESKFEGLESSPVARERQGLRIVLLSGRLGSLKPGSPVYYRGIDVGAVQECQLSTNATAVDIHVFIRRRYAKLVRNGSLFWNVSGVDARVGLFRGVEINVESLRSLVAGGIAFATPNDPKGEPAKDGMVFHLYDEPKKEWLEWAPEITFSPQE